MISDWMQCQLGELFDFKNGLNAEKAAYGDGVPFVNVMDVFGNDILTAEIIRGKMQATAKQVKDYSVIRGDVLFNRTSETFDEIAMSAVYLDDQPAVFGGFVIRARPRDRRLNPHFCAYYFQSGSFRKELIRRGQGAVRANIGQKDLAVVPAIVPTLPEQQCIAEILSTWDRAIEATEKLIANSEAQKKALMQQLLTGKKRLPGFDGEWKTIRLKSVLTEEKERNKSKTIQRVLSVTNHSGFVLPEHQFSKRVASDDVSNYKVVKRGQFAYNPSRLNVGSFARLTQYDVGILSPMYVVFSVQEQRLNSDYFHFWMSTSEARQRVLSNVQGSVRDSVAFDALCGFPFKLPPITEQIAIASMLSDANREIELLIKKCGHLKSEKSALMQQLLTGKRRVKINKEEAA